MRVERMRKVWTLVTVVAFFLIYPVFVTPKGYINFVDYKFVAFAVITIVVLAVTLCIELFYKEKSGSFCFAVTDYFVVAYLISNTVSLCISEYTAVSFTGSIDRRMGYFTILIMCFAYLIFRIVDIDVKTFCIVASCGFVIVSLFAILQFMGIDLFGFISVIDKDNVLVFTSTLGNTMHYAEYICIMWPIAIYGAIYFENEICILASSAFLPALMASNSDAAYVGALLELIVLVLFFTIRNKHCEFLLILISNLLASIVFRVGYLLGEAPRPYSNITRFFMQNRALILLAALILFYILSITKFKQINNKRAFLKVYRNIFICIAIAVVFSCVYFTFINTSVELGRITSIFRIRDGWGTDRGYAWEWCLRAFGAAPLVNKFFGYGQAMAPFILHEMFGREMLISLGFTFSDAHNIYLHQLLSIGVCGVVTFAGVIVSAIYSGVRCERTDDVYGFMNILNFSFFTLAIIDLVTTFEPVIFGYLWILCGMITRFYKGCRGKNL